MKTHTQNTSITNYIYLNLRNRRHLWFKFFVASVTTLFIIRISSLIRNSGFLIRNFKIFPNLPILTFCSMSAPSGSVKSDKRPRPEKQANACKSCQITYRSGPFLVKSDPKVVHFLPKPIHFLTKIFRNLQKSRPHLDMYYPLSPRALVLSYPRSFVPSCPRSYKITPNP